MSELKSRITEYFEFSKKELKNLIICSLIFGFIFAFRSWDSLIKGFSSVILLSIFVLLSMLLHLSAQKIHSLKYGHIAEFEIWWIGIAISLLLVFFTNGWVRVILPGGIFMIFVSRLRIGEFRYGTDFLEKAFVSLTGPLTSLFFAIILKTINSFLNSTILNEIILINITLAIATMLPLPKLNGLNIYFANRTFYIFSFMFITSIIAFMYLINIWITLLFAIIVAIISTIYYTHRRENIL